MDRPKTKARALSYRTGHNFSVWWVGINKLKTHPPEWNSLIVIGSSVGVEVDRRMTGNRFRAVWPHWLPSSQNRLPGEVVWLLHISFGYWLLLWLFLTFYLAT